jgi:hypothetical protein
MGHTLFLKFLMVLEILIFLSRLDPPWTRPWTPTWSSSFNLNFNSNRWDGMIWFCSSQCGLSKRYDTFSQNSAWFRCYEGLKEKKTLVCKTQNWKSLEWSREKWNISRTMQNWEKLARATFLGHIPPNISVSYHEVDPSWTSSWNLKLKIAGPARPALRGHFLIIQSSPTVMNYQECYFSRRKTCFEVPKKKFRQGGTYP